MNSNLYGLFSPLVLSLQSQSLSLLCITETNHLESICTNFYYEFEKIYIPGILIYKRNIVLPWCLMKVTKCLMKCLKKDIWLQLRNFEYYKQSFCNTCSCALRVLPNKIYYELYSMLFNYISTCTPMFSLYLFCFFFGFLITILINQAYE